MKPVPVLYLSYDGMTDPLGQSQVIPYLAGLSAAGYAISLISFEKPEKAARKPHIAQLLAGHGIDWHPLPYTKTPPVLSTVRDLRAMKRLALRLHRAKGFGLVHCRSYIAALAGLWLKRKAGLPFVFDMRGFWADERVDGHLWHLKNPVFRLVYRYFKQKEKEFLTEAAQVVSLTHNAKAEMESWALPKPLAPVTVIPCCADMDLFSAANSGDRLAVRQQLGLEPGQLVLSYLGSLGTWYMLPEMLAFFKCLWESQPHARFLFVTADAPAAIQAEAVRQDIDPGLLAIVRAEREEVPAYLAASDLAVFFILPAFSKKASSPTKQGELMGMGIPVICNGGVGDTALVVEQYGAGWVVPAFSEAAYREAVAQLPALLQPDRERIMAGAKAFYGLEKGVEAYKAVYAASLKGQEGTGKAPNTQ